MSKEHLPENFYAQVASYFDTDAQDYESRSEKNHILKKIRAKFRSVTEKFPFNNILEIGCGPGMDLLYFGKKYPQAFLYGFDVSEQMLKMAHNNLGKSNIHNVQIAQGTPEHIDRMFPGKKFDLVYCYFGALNTVADLETVAASLHNATQPQSHLVLTFINRWYLADIFFQLGLLRFSQAFARVRNTWQGYSPHKKITSTCRSLREVRTAFKKYFDLKNYQAYSILYPAWYRPYLAPEGSLREKILWKSDQLINKLPRHNIGEYSLYVLKKIKL